MQGPSQAKGAALWEKVRRLDSTRRTVSFVIALEMETRHFCMEDVVRTSYNSGIDKTGTPPFGNGIAGSSEVVVAVVMVILPRPITR